MDEPPSFLGGNMELDKIQIPVTYDELKSIIDGMNLQLTMKVKNKKTDTIENIDVEVYYDPQEI